MSARPPVRSAGVGAAAPTRTAATWGAPGRRHLWVAISRAGNPQPSTLAPTREACEKKLGEACGSPGAARPLEAGAFTIIKLLQTDER